MTANNRTLALASGLILLAFVPAAQATLAVAASFDEKVENASSIVLGRCIKTESRMDQSGRWILTYSTFQVEQSMKGTAGTQITVVTPGGKVGSLRQDTIGVPEFREGDESVIFVKQSASGPTVLYFDQGAYDVIKDARGEKIVAPVATSVVRIDTQRGLAVPPESPRSLRDFSRDVNEAVAEGRQRKMRYEMIQKGQQAKQEASLGSVVARYKYVIAIALLGIALTTWQLLKR